MPTDNITQCVIQYIQPNPCVCECRCAPSTAGNTSDISSYFINFTALVGVVTVASHPLFYPLIQRLYQQGNVWLGKNIPLYTPIQHTVKAIYTAAVDATTAITRIRAFHDTVLAHFLPIWLFPAINSVIYTCILGNNALVHATEARAAQAATAEGQKAITEQADTSSSSSKQADKAIVSEEQKTTAQQADTPPSPLTPLSSTPTPTPTPTLVPQTNPEQVAPLTLPPSSTSSIPAPPSPDPSSTSSLPPLHPVVQSVQNAEGNPIRVAPLIISRHSSGHTSRPSSPSLVGASSRATSTASIFYSPFITSRRLSSAPSTPSPLLSNTPSPLPSHPSTPNEAAAPPLPGETETNDNTE